MTKPLSNNEMAEKATISMKRSDRNFRFGAVFGGLTAIAGVSTMVSAYEYIAQGDPYNAVAAVGGVALSAVMYGESKNAFEKSHEDKLVAESYNRQLLSHEQVSSISTESA